MTKAEIRTHINLAMRAILTEPAKLGLSLKEAASIQRQVTREFLLAQ